MIKFDKKLMVIIRDLSQILNFSLLNSGQAQLRFTHVRYKKSPCCKEMQCTDFYSTEGNCKTSKLPGCFGHVSQSLPLCKTKILNNFAKVSPRQRFPLYVLLKTLPPVCMKYTARDES